MIGVFFVHFVEVEFCDFIIFYLFLYNKDCVRLKTCIIWLIIENTKWMPHLKNSTVSSSFAQN
jgi:hypothetical protein